MATYPEEGKVNSPDDVGDRRMPKRETYTHVAGDVVSGPGRWDLDKADLRRMNTEINLQHGRLTSEELGRTSGVGSQGGKVIPIKPE